MQACPKCGGAMERQEIGGQTFLQCLREGACQGRILLRNGEAPMGKEWTPERRAKFQATMEARRAARGKSASGGGAISMPLRKKRHEHQAVRRQPRDAKHGSVIDQLLGEIDAKIAQLEHARQLIEQSRELLTA